MAMAEQLTFIHAADLHLGAPFLGLRTVSGEWAERMAESIPEAYERLIEAALERRVDFVVLAGDIFDEAHPSYGEYLRFVQGIERLGQAGIPVYFCTGNHDPYTSWQRDYGSLPANAHMFPAGEEAGFFLYERAGVPLAVLAGRGYYNQTWQQGADISAGLTRKAAEDALGVSTPFAVGVLHTGLDIDPTKAPVSPGKLRAMGMDYWALGHIHRPLIDNSEDPRIAFSGCIQGRKIRDEGARGAYLVTLAEGQPNTVEFVPTASVVWERVSLDVSEARTLADLAQRAIGELFRLNGEAYCDEMIERIVLKGATPLHSLLQRPAVLEDVRRQINEAYSGFFCDALIDETRAPFERDKALAEGLFPATYLQVAQENSRARSEELSYLQQAFIDKGIGISDVSDELLARLEEDAESLVVDLLVHGEGQR